MGFMVRLLLFYTSTACCATPVLHDAPYDPIKSFTPITQVVKNAYVLVVGADSPFNNVQDLLNHAKQNPDELKYASDALGSQLTSALFTKLADVKMRHIPYNGSVAAAVAVSNGEVDMLFTGIGAIAGFVKGEKLKMIGVTSVEPIGAAPEVPSISKTVSDFSFGAMMGIAAPAGTPTPIINKLNDAFQAALADEAVWSRIAAMGQEKPDTTSPAEFAKLIEHDVEKWKSLIREAGIK